MKLHRSAHWNLVAIIPVLLALALVLACGSAAPDPADSPSADQPAAKSDTPPATQSNPQANIDASPKAAPTAVPEKADAPAMAVKSEGDGAFLRPSRGDDQPPDLRPGHGAHRRRAVTAG